MKKFTGITLLILLGCLFSPGAEKKMPKKLALNASDETHSSFGRVLISNGPSPQMPKSAVAVFGWLVGDWEADVYDYDPDGSKWIGKGEWLFLGPRRARYPGRLDCPKIGGSKYHNANGAQPIWINSSHL